MKLMKGNSNLFVNPPTILNKSEQTKKYTELKTIDEKRLEHDTTTESGHKNIGLLKSLITKNKNQLKNLTQQSKDPVQFANEDQILIQEQVLTINEECRKKYFYEGNCILN